MRNRKETAWRKNRRFGEVHGGRRWPKVADGIIRRAHNLQPPGPNDETPILIQENPSSDFFFPVDGLEALGFLKQLPDGQIRGITHLWLRRVKRSDYRAERVPLAEFAYGRRVGVITLYPWPKDRRLWFGTRKPSDQALKMYERWSPELEERKDGWYLRFTQEALRKLYIEHLLLREVGRNVDSFRRAWSKANVRQSAESASQYAIQWARDGVLFHQPDGET